MHPARLASKQPAHGRHRLLIGAVRSTVHDPEAVIKPFDDRVPGDLSELHLSLYHHLGDAHSVFVSPSSSDVFLKS